jgi:hypothetical protein
MHGERDLAEELSDIQVATSAHEAVTVPEFVAIGLNGAEIAAWQPSSKQAIVRDFKQAIGHACGIDAQRQKLLVEGSVLEDEDDLMGKPLQEGSMRMVVQLIVLPYFPCFHISTRLCHGISCEHSNGGFLLTHTGKGNRSLSNGWATICSTTSLPHGEATSWETIIEHVAGCGDVIVGLLCSEASISDICCKELAFSFVVAGSPSGMLAINHGCSDFGGGTTNNMIQDSIQRSYCERIPWIQAAGTRFCTCWDGHSLSFSLLEASGARRDLGLAFKGGGTSGDASDSMLPLPKDAHFFPFYTFYGSGTKVIVCPAKDT